MGRRPLRQSRRKRMPTSAKSTVSLLKKGGAAIVVVFIISFVAILNRITISSQHSYMASVLSSSPNRDNSVVIGREDLGIKGYIPVEQKKDLISTSNRAPAPELLEPRHGDGNFESDRTVQQSLSEQQSTPIYLDTTLSEVNTNGSRILNEDAIKKRTMPVESLFLKRGFLDERLTYNFTTSLVHREFAHRIFFDLQARGIVVVSRKFARGSLMNHCLYGASTITPCTTMAKFEFSVVLYDAAGASSVKGRSKDAVTESHELDCCVLQAGMLLRAAVAAKHMHTCVGMQRARDTR